MRLGRDEREYSGWHWTSAQLKEGMRLNRTEILSQENGLI